MTRNHLPSLVGLLALLTVLTGLQPAFARPAIEHPVNDYAGIIAPDDEDLLAKRIMEVHQLHGVQIAILVVDSTLGEPIEDYSWRAATEWGGGSQVRSDGILITLAVADRQWRMELGYDAEAWITDGEAARFLDDQKGYLRTSAYTPALLNVIELAKAEFEKAGTTPEPGGESGYESRPYTPARDYTPLYVLIIVLSVLAVALLFVWLTSREHSQTFDSALSVTHGYSTVPLSARARDSLFHDDDDDWGPSSSLFDDDDEDDWGYSGSSSSVFDDDDDDDWGSSSSSNSRSWSGGGGSFGGGGASSSW